MSQYPTAADLALHGAPATTLSSFLDGEITAGLVAGSDEADAELNRRYDLPIAEPYPPALIQRVCWITAYELLTTRGFDSADEGNSYRRRAEAARAWLKRIGDGTLDLVGLIDATPEDESTGDYAIVTDSRRGW
jgi:phage gp36-like protein